MNEATDVIYVNAENYMNTFMRASLHAMKSWADRHPRTLVDETERVFVKLAERSFYSEHKDTLEAFIASLREEAAGAPEGAEVLITLRSGDGYDDERGDPEYEIGYWRDPTDEEVAERRAHNAEAAEHNAKLEARKADEEREEFERLKAKYEG